MLRRQSLFILAVSLVGCGGGTSGEGDAGALDAAALDAATLDGGALDAQVIDRDGSSGDAGTVGECPLALACDAPPPDPGPSADWRHSIQSAITVGLGSPRHRGRDLVLREGDPQWALAKLAYGANDDDLQDEDVSIYLLRDCGTTWEELGVATTTNDDEHPIVEGVVDTGGRVYFEIPAAQRLGIGRHRIHFVVRGDLTTADQIIEVLPSDARFVVTDVDGTQTESETAEWGAVLGGADVAANPSGAELMTAYARRGYHVFYLTARPDWLDARTHEWLASHGYPPGIVHTTLSTTGVVGDAATIAFKTSELQALLDRFPGGLEDAIGNTNTDVAAYANVAVPPDRLFTYQYDPGPTGTRVDDYATLIPMVEARAASCR